LKKRNITREYIINDNDLEIQCTISRKDCRSLRIAITPDLKVKISAPLRASESFIHDSLQKKIPWIIKSMNRLKNRQVLQTPDKYVSGEKLAYLGKEFTLKVIKGKKEPVILFGDSLMVKISKTDIRSVKRELDKWYRTRAETIFGRYLREGYSIVSQYVINEPFLKIRRMKSRWGSCSRSGKITLNLRLIHLPPVCIEYIVMHELCHLRYLNHSKDFYTFLQKCMPDWKDRKKILESFRLNDG
jgi:hypothetical protein